MPNRRSYQYPSGVNWHSVSPPSYTSSEYSTTTYQSHTHPSSAQTFQAPVYEDLNSPASDGDYSPSYYPTNSSYNAASPSSGQMVYSPVSQQDDHVNMLHGMRPTHHQQYSRSHSTHPYATSYTTPTSTQTDTYMHSYTSNSQPRERSHSQAHAYVPQQTNSPSYPTHNSYPNNGMHYPPQIPLTPVLSTSPSQYPTSPSRPFSCDLCTLSFNRQHDLKRHRETHTGEKPYFCNGGCGKTFTRKDALKRHQLVKNCGKADENWST